MRLRMFHQPVLCLTILAQRRGSRNDGDHCSGTLHRLEMRAFGTRRQTGNWIRSMVTFRSITKGAAFQSLAADNGFSAKVLRELLLG